MRHQMTQTGAPRRGRGPEEIALDAWIEDAEPYVSLVDVVGAGDAARRPGPPAPRTSGRAHAPLPVRSLTPIIFD